MNFSTDPRGVRARPASRRSNGPSRGGAPRGRASPRARSTGDVAEHHRERLARLAEGFGAASESPHAGRNVEVVAALPPAGSTVGIAPTLAARFRSGQRLPRLGRPRLACRGCRSRSPASVVATPFFYGSARSRQGKDVSIDRPDEVGEQRPDRRLSVTGEARRPRVAPESYAPASRASRGSGEHWSSGSAGSPPGPTTSAAPVLRPVCTEQPSRSARRHPRHDGRRRKSSAPSSGPLDGRSTWRPCSPPPIRSRPPTPAVAK